MSAPFDTIIVPDFSGRAARVFELRTLLFLSMWRRYAGRAANFPVHVAAIGEAPDSVRGLAGEMGVRLYAFEPFDPELGVFANKFRAWEVERETEHALFLDDDVLAWDDLGDLCRADDDLAATPASVPRVPLKWWEKILRQLDLPEPEPMPTTMQEGSWGWGADAPVRDHEGKPFPSVPYFNAGVVLFRWALADRLKELWLRDMKAIQEMVPRDGPDWRAVAYCEQTALATAVHRLRLEGNAFRRLPEDYDVRWHHLHLQWVKPSQTRFFHALGYLKHPDWLPRRNGLLARSYGWHLAHRVSLLMVRERRKLGRWPSFTRQWLPSLADAWTVHRRITRVYNEDVAPRVR